MIKRIFVFCAAYSLFSLPASALELAPEEFMASQELACVLAEQSLGRLSEEEYGARFHTALDGFAEGERDNILAKALGYVEGLSFELAGQPSDAQQRLEIFLASDSCASEPSYYRTTVSI